MSTETSMIETELHKLIRSYEKRHISYKYWYNVVQEKPVFMDSYLYWHLLTEDRDEIIHCPFADFTKVGSSGNDPLILELFKVLPCSPCTDALYEGPTTFITQAWIKEETEHQIVLNHLHPKYELMKLAINSNCAQNMSKDAQTQLTAKG